LAAGQRIVVFGDEIVSYNYARDGLLYRLYVRMHLSNQRKLVGAALPTFYCIYCMKGFGPVGA
jgi:hypothetical protein